MAKYWRSLEELYEKPAFQDYLHREFPEAASMLPEGVSRRRWLQVMGASLALAGASGCRWEDEKIATYIKRPENRIPGVPVKYATLLERAGVAIGVLATSYDGRPIKLDINPEHPQGFRGSDAQLQGYVLQMYDPDRIPREPETGRHRQLYDPKYAAVLRQKENGKFRARTWERFEQFAANWWSQAQGKNGAGVRVISGANSSPTAQRLKSEFLSALPQAKWVEYEPLSRAQEAAGVEQAFGSTGRLKYQLAEADVVLGLDSDLLDFHPDALRHAREWADRRVPEAGQMNRVYAVESCFSGLGQVADHRLPLATSQVAAFTGDLLDALQSALNGSPPQKDAAEGDSKASFLGAVVDDLVKHKGRSVVVAGPRQAPEVHAACLLINSLLDNLGKTVVVLDAADSPQDPRQAVAELVSEMKAGSVETLIVLGGNPGYDAPAELGFCDAMESVPTVLRLGQYQDETAEKSTWYLPMAHELESWGDGRSWDGTIGIRQPLLTALHRGVTESEFLAILMQKSTRDGQQQVQSTLEGLVPGLNQKAWNKAIHDGFVADSAYAVKSELSLAENLQGQLETWLKEAAEKARQTAEGSFEVVLLPDEAVFDGRYANNAWLQETPASLTKITWDNVAIIGPRTAKNLSVKDGDLVSVTLQGRSIEIPVFQMPGLPENTLGISCGYGRTAAGHVGGSLQDDVEPVGVNAYELMPAQGAQYFFTAEVKKTGKEYQLASTQSHWAIDLAGMREIGKRVGMLVREGTLEEFQEHSDFAQHKVHHPPLESLWTEREWDAQYQWGMSVDLSRCIGCNGCVVSCTAENNVPVVGKDQVRRNREMHWLRIDRYFVGDQDIVEKINDQPESIGVSTQPVLCMQCENAPCEQVCPVAATIHSKEGLNDMVYNRCIGTRYCSNNCPYKVRRFNYFSNAKPLMEPEMELVQLVLNPEVTVRSRGVMEKCTYCVQRIQNGKIQAKNENRLVRDGEIKTACQEACPTDAIKFGNLRDKESEVYKLHQNDRTYGMLEELNVKPRTKYLARIRNPHPWLAGGYFLQPGEHHHHGEHHDGAHEHDYDHDHDSDPVPTPQA